MQGKQTTIRWAAEQPMAVGRQATDGGGQRQSVPGVDPKCCLPSLGLLLWPTFFFFFLLYMHTPLLTDMLSDVAAVLRPFAKT